jgi:hypothetical protein
MKIKQSTPPLTVSGPEVTFVLEDKGSAHVSIILSIEGFPPIEHDETYKGAKTTTLQLTKGTYACNLYVAAYKYGALGPAYDTRALADGVLLAAAKGAIAKADASDRDWSDFDLVVT